MTPSTPRPTATAAAEPFQPPTPEPDTPQTPEGNKSRFASVRADRDVILKRAIVGRVLGIVETLYGKLDTPTVRGFDLAMVPLAKPRFLGATAGRYANRIAKAKFSLDGKTYTLPANNGVNSLHGGTAGWDTKLWQMEPFQNAEGVGAVLTLTSADGDMGYPGEVKAKVTYRLMDDSRFIVDYEATTNAPTVINMTQHTYFNLAGQAKFGDILGQELMINADKYTPVDDTLIPTGQLAPVEGTPFDFRASTKIGARIEQKDEQLIRGKGYDHNWVLTRTGDGLQLAAVAKDPVSGRTLSVAGQIREAPSLEAQAGRLVMPADLPEAPQAQAARREQRIAGFIARRRRARVGVDRRQASAGLGRRLAGVGADAAVREGAAIVLGVVEAALGLAGPLHLRLLDELGIRVLRDRDFGGGGVAAVLVAEQLPGVPKVLVEAVGIDIDAGVSRAAPSA